MNMEEIEWIQKEIRFQEEAIRIHTKFKMEKSAIYRKGWLHALQSVLKEFKDSELNEIKM
jgi:hypothetical protein